MKTIVSAICVTALMATTMGLSAAPASAAQYGIQHKPTVIHVVPKKGHDSHGKKWRFEKKGSYVYLNGHRGDRHRHAGWKEYNGYWFPPTAFFLGAIIGGILGSQHH